MGRLAFLLGVYVLDYIDSITKDDNPDAYRYVFSGLVLGMLLTQRHPEYAVHLLNTTLEATGTKERDDRLVDNLVKRCPIEGVEA